MGIRAEVGWSIWREQVTWLAERILLRISMEDILPRMARIHHKGVQLSLLHQPNCYSPHRMHGTHGTFCWERLPRMARMDTDGRVLSRGCTCLKCTNRARSAPTEQYRYPPTDFRSAQMLVCAEFNHGLNGYEGAWRFNNGLNGLNGNKGACSENPINQINPLWKKYIVRVRRNLTRIERIERIAGCGENQINQINPLWKKYC